MKEKNKSLIPKTVNTKTFLATILTLTIVVAFTLNYALSAGTVTIVPASFVETASYTVWEDSGTYYAKNGLTGAIDYNGTDATTVIQAAIDVLPSDGVVQLREGTFTVNTINPKANIWIRGVGKGTILTSSVTNRFFTISNINDVVISDLAMVSSHVFPDPLIYIEGDAAIVRDIVLRNLKLTLANTNVGITLETKNTGGICFVTIKDCEIYGGDYGIIFNPLATANNWVTGCYLNNILFDTFNTTAIVFANGNTTVYGANYNILDNLQFRHTVATATKGIHVAGFAYCTQIKTPQFWKDGAGTFIALQFDANSNYADVIGGHIEGGSVVDNGVGTKIRLSDHQYVTENSGTAEFANNSTTTFNHELAGTPTFVCCSFNDTATGAYKWTATSMNITVTVVNSGNYTVYWSAKYKP